MSVFEVTCQNEDIYFDVNQRIIAVFSRLLDRCLQGDKGWLRNACEVLRTIFGYLGYSTSRSDIPENKLVCKLMNIFLPVSSFINKPDPGLRSSNNSRLISLVLTCR